MANYEAIKKEIEAGTNLNLLCTTCAWDMYCISPPEMTSAQKKAKMDELSAPPKSSADGSEVNPSGSLIGVMLTSMLYAGADSKASVCPVFADKLRQSRQLSDAIKSLMQGKSPNA